MDEEDKRQLLKIARMAIEEYLKSGKRPYIDIDRPALYEEWGAFVTLKQGRRLRGCIGTLQPEGPLYQTVMEMAIASATQDYRFPPLSLDEIPKTKIEISVLSPFTRIEDPKEIEVGRHGLYIVKGFYRGVLLPQVAVEQGWDRETFLRHLCLKAGLDADAWEGEADIYTFTAEIIEEE